MDISNKFSLVDFLAYFFPGIISTLGLFLLLLLTPLGTLLTLLPTDLVTGIILLTISYVIGVVLSGFAEITFRTGVKFKSCLWVKSERILRTRAKFKPRLWIKAVIPIAEFREEIISAFSTMFEEDKETKVEWSDAHFYICRSLVFEFMPGLAQLIQRQSSLRQLRMNLIPAVTICSIVGVGWGIRAINSTMPVWGYALTISSAILWLLVVGTIINRMNRNEEREVREVLTAFLAGYEKGLFERQESRTSNKEKMI